MEQVLDVPDASDATHAFHERGDVLRVLELTAKEHDPADGVHVDPSLEVRVHATERLAHDTVDESGVISRRDLIRAKVSHLPGQAVRLSLRRPGAAVEDSACVSEGAVGAV